MTDSIQTQTTETAYPFVPTDALVILDATQTYPYVVIEGSAPREMKVSEALKQVFGSGTERWWVITCSNSTAGIPDLALVGSTGNPAKTYKPTPSGKTVFNLNVVFSSSWITLENTAEPIQLTNLSVQDTIKAAQEAAGGTTNWIVECGGSTELAVREPWQPMITITGGKP